MNEGGARIGVMGGTFDPIHHGHLVAASKVGHAFSLDEVVFVPTGHPEDKEGASPAEDRYLMTVIATASNPQFTAGRGQPTPSARCAPCGTRGALTPGCSSSPARSR